MTTFILDENIRLQGNYFFTKMEEEISYFKVSAILEQAVIGVHFLHSINIS